MSATPSQPARRAGARRLAATGACAVASLLASVVPLTSVLRPAAAATMQDEREIRITGDRLGGFVLPTLPIDSPIMIHATNTLAWRVDDTQRLLLDGDVRIGFGGYDFSADRAYVWLNRLPTDDGAVTQLAIWFPEADEPNRRAGLAAAGENLLVTGTSSGAVELRTVARTTGSPESLDRIRANELARAEARLAVHLRELLADPPPPLDVLPQADQPRPFDPPIPVPGASAILPDADARRAAEIAALPSSVRVPLRTSGDLPIFQPDGLVAFSADEIEIDLERDVVVTRGGFVVDYDPLGSEDVAAPLQLRAENGVLFLREGAIDAIARGDRRVDAAEVLGIYLEGNVLATDGQYLVRARSVYYDLERNEAVMVDALLRTGLREGGSVPVYARAAELRQISESEWAAERATVSTSRFFTPHISIGLERVTVRNDVDDLGETQPIVSGEKLVLRAGDFPIFGWPKFTGGVADIPFRGMGVGYDGDRGVEIETKWDAASLLGLDLPDGVDAELRVDGYTERGPAIGLAIEQQSALSRGRLEAYGLYDFGGTDTTSAGGKVDVDEGLRGKILGAWDGQLSSTLFMQARLSWLSDESWAGSWDREQFDSGMELETSLFLDRRVRNTSLSLLGRADLSGFSSTGWQLASRPYFVEKLPEIAYRRVGDSIFRDLFTWTSEYSGSWMRIRPSRGNAESLGVPRGSFFAPNDSVQVRELYADNGYSDEFLARLDTRQEISMPLGTDGSRIVPYASARLSGYINEEFERYDSEAESIRFLGTVGVRMSTRILRVQNDIRSRLLDIDRLRHVAEPYVHAFASYSNAENGATPVYDQSIEGATQSAAVQAGWRHTVQTMRGGPGERRSVDWVTLDAGVVVSDAAADEQRVDNGNPYRVVQSPVPQFISWRPELSQWGSHAYGSAAIELSDTFSIGGTATWLFEDRQILALLDDGSSSVETIDGLARGSVGFQMRHSPEVSTYLEYRYLAPSDTELLQLGLAYQVGRRYAITLTPQYDIGEGELRAIQGTLLRTFPDFDLTLRGGYDIVRDEPTLALRVSLIDEPR